MYFGKKLFLSYARDDDEPFVKKLYEYLTEAGYDVWWDRVSMPSRGLTFLDEIRKAIDDSDRLLLIIGSDAVTSDYVRAEWEHALRRCMPINPILRLGGFDLLPPELAMIDARDFRENAVFDTQLEMLISQIETNPGKLGSLVGASSLPPQHITRHDDLKPIRDFALAHTRDVEQAHQMIGVHGMGGVGKSVLVRALVEECEVRRAYPDGIYWITIGKETRLESRQEQLGVALGDSPIHYKNDVQGNRASLAKMLENRTCLIVLDDVWERTAVDAFDALGTNCHLLYTTRNGEIALSLGVAQHRLTAMSDAEALALLHKWTQGDHLRLPDVANRLGNLPLGLKLAGARIGNGMRVEDWLVQFTQVEQIKLGRRSTDPQDNLLVSLELSVNELPTDDQPLYHTLGMFPEDVWIPLRIVTLAWQAFDPSLTDFDCSELVSDLVNLALVEHAENEAAYRLHDLLHDYNHEKLGTSLPTHHAQFLDHLRKPQQTWTEIASAFHTEYNEAYLFYYLAYHLDAADHPDELHELLTGSPNWLQAKFTICVGDTAYVADLQLTLERYSDSVTETQLLKLVELITAWQLVNARVGKYGNEILQTLVWLDRTEEAISYARLRSDIQKRFEGVLLVYKSLNERSQASDWLIDELEKDAHHLENVSSHSYELNSLAKALFEAGEYARAEQVALQIKNANYRASALHDLAVALARSGEREVARRLFDYSEQATYDISMDVNKTGRLHSLAKALSEAGEYAHAKQVALQIEHVAFQLDALCALSVALAQAGKHEASKLLLIQAEQLMKWVEIQDQNYAMNSLIVAFARAGDYVHAEQIMQQIVDKSVDAYVLRELAMSFARAGNYTHVEQVIIQIRDPFRKASALCELAVFTLGTDNQKVAQRLFNHSEQVAQRIAHDSQLRQLVVAMAQAGQYTQAERLVLRIQSPSEQSSALCKLAVSLMKARQDAKSLQIFDNTKQVVQQIENPLFKVWALCDLATALAQVGMREAAQQIFDSGEQASLLIGQAESNASTLAQLAVSLARMGEHNRAERIAQRIDHKSEKLEVLCTLGVIASRAGKPEEALRLLAQAEQLVLNNGYDRDRTLCKLVDASVNIGGYAYAEKLAQQIGNVSSQASALCDLAISLVSTGKREEALRLFTYIEQLIQQIENVYSRIPVLGKLSVAMVQASKQEEALRLFTYTEQLIQQIEYWFDKVRAFGELSVAMVQAGEYERAERLAEQIANSFGRAEAFGELSVAMVQAGEYERAERLAEQISDAYYQVPALIEIAATKMQVGETSAALRLFAQLEQLAQQIHHPSARASVLGKLSVAMVKIGNYRYAHKMTKQVVEYMHNSMQITHPKAEVEAKLAGALAQEHQYVSAFTVLGSRDLSEYIQFLAMLYEPVSQCFDESIWYILMWRALRIVCWEQQEWQLVLDVFDEIAREQDLIS